MPGNGLIRTVHFAVAVYPSWFSYSHYLCLFPMPKGSMSSRREKRWKGKFLVLSHISGSKFQDKRKLTLEF